VTTHTLDTPDRKMSNIPPETSSSTRIPNPASPQRPKHLINRSISEISPPSLPKLHHKHHHHPHVHRKDKESQSTNLNLQPYPSSEQVSGSRSEGVTPSGSRAGSVWGLDQDGNGNGKEKRVVKEGEVKEEREKGVLRATYVSIP